MTFEEYAKKQIGLPESNQLKYKALLPSNIEIGRIICAFANTGGGLLILGVLNKYNKITVTGLSDDFRVESVLKKAILKIAPLPVIEKGFIEYEGKKLFVIKVEKATQIVTYNQTQYEISSRKINKLEPANMDINGNDHKTKFTMNYETKLDKVLKYLVENPKLINVNKHTIAQVIFNNDISLSEAENLIEKLRASGYVNSYAQRYIGCSNTTEAFVENGGYSGTKQKNIASLKSSKNIFISYNWNLKESAQKLYDFLKFNGYSPSMDDHNLRYKDKLSTFMESIRSSDFSILIISDEYLKSENCMTEVLHLLKDADFHKKVLPIRDSNLKIFKTSDRLKYLHYWNSQVREKEEMLKGLDQTNAIEELKKLRTAKYIQQNILDFLVEIADMLTYTIEEQESKSYKDILGYIEHAGELSN